MPFLKTCIHNEAMRFITIVQAGDDTMTAICEAFGISRQWGYELVRRYERDGPKGLHAKSRAPHEHGLALGEEITHEILSLRGTRPYWGPKKLRAYLMRHQPLARWPAASTIGDLLRREGLSRSKKRRRTQIPLTQPFAQVKAVNDLWCIDFKGWFRTGDGTRCDPLTLSDAHSRFLLSCEIIPPRFEFVDQVVERAMRKHGLPKAIRSDNGPPFASNGAGGLSRLAVKWIKLGIKLERCDPASPQQNGRHERMHATLKAQTAKPPADTKEAQQDRFNAFIAEYNHERPHEALGQTTPASHYTSSSRNWTDSPKSIAYNDAQAIRMVRSNGQIKWGGDLIYISDAIHGEPVGIAETSSGDWIVHYDQYPLGIINRATKKLKPFSAIRPGTSKSAKQNGKSVNDLSGL
jgi:putative transposase